MKCVDCGDDVYEGEAVFDDDGDLYCPDCHFEYVISHEGELDENEWLKAELELTKEGES